MQFEHIPIDTVKEFWNRRPCNIQHSAKPLGSKEYFDEVEARKYFVERHIIRFSEFPRWNTKRVLEIGCGIGTTTINFARNGAQVTAIDLSEKSLEIASRRASVYGLTDRIQFYQGSAEELTEFVPVQPYDLIYSFGVIHHTPHPEQVIRQIRYYVQPGTVIKLMVYYRYSWKALSILATLGKWQFWRLEELIARYSEAQTGCPVTYTYTKDQIRQLLADYKIEDLWVDHIFPYKIDDYVKYQYKREWYFEYLPRPVFQWLERNFGWHLCVTASVPI